MTPEGKVKDEVRKFLESLGADCWFYQPVPMGYGKRGVPDFIICYKGFFLAPETKRKGGKGQAWQDDQQIAINKAGGSSGRITDISILKAWVQEVDTRWRVLGIGGVSLNAL